MMKLWSKTNKWAPVYQGRVMDLVKRYPDGWVKLRDDDFREYLVPPNVIRFSRV